MTTSRPAALVTGASYGVGAATALRLRGRDSMSRSRRRASRTLPRQSQSWSRQACVPCRSCWTCARRPASNARRQTCSLLSAGSMFWSTMPREFAQARGRCDCPGMERGDGGEPDRDVLYDAAGRPSPDRAGPRCDHQRRVDPRAGGRRGALDLRHFQGGAGADDADAGGRMGRARRPRQRRRVRAACDGFAVARGERCRPGLHGGDAQAHPAAPARNGRRRSRARSPISRAPRRRRSPVRCWCSMAV